MNESLTAPLGLTLAGPAEMRIPCIPLGPTLDFFVEQLGFRVETIFPADEPHTASVSGHGLRLRLEPSAGDPGVIRLPYRGPGATLTAPNGTRVELVDRDPPLVVPPLRPELLITRREQGPAGGVGRAGMLYRDLIPGRLGGRYIASHIAIPEGGPVADWVHFHNIRFQMIFCRRGWVRLVYEDQGPAFILEAGDCVVQPPRIRHRVLESSPGLEVVEIGCPALHETFADHDMELPTGRTLPERDFSGQTFLHHVAAVTPWAAQGGLERRDTGVGQATRGITDAYVLRPGEENRLAPATNAGDLLFGFMLEGSAVIDCRGIHAVGPSDAFVVPPGEIWALDLLRPDARILVVTSAST